MSYKPIHIRKFSGEEEVFEIKKLITSLANAGANNSEAMEIAKSIEKELYQGITTKEIYRKAHQLLKKREKSKAARYGLKQGLLQLGPTGYPFELYVGELMKCEGYTVEIGKVMSGKCVTHEVDVLANNADKSLMIECKFHNRPGYKSDVKVPLYIKSRFEDLKAVWVKEEAHRHKTLQGWVVTNSRFTLDAIQYGTCSGLHMLSWDYPENYNLNRLASKHRLYPVTVVPGINKEIKEAIMNEGIVLAKDLCVKPDLLEKLLKNRPKVEKIITEINEICSL